jgi:hypothetical protein
MFDILVLLVFGIWSFFGAWVLGLGDCFHHLPFAAGAVVWRGSKTEVTQKIGLGFRVNGSAF